MTTYLAKQVIGSNAAANPAGALLQSGANRADDSATGDTWIFLNTVNSATNPWGIFHSQVDNKIKIIGDGTDDFWVDMDTGDTYILGNVGIGYDPETSGNTYKLYVNGSTYFNGNTTHNGIDYFANGTTYYIDNSANGYLNALQLKTNLTFDATGTTGTSGKITWSGSTDAADIYYYVPTSDQGNLIINTRDDTNCLVAFAYNGTIKAYINNSTPSFYPATTNTGTIGTSTYEWGTTYTRAINARHFDASYPYTSDRNMYYGYNKADNHYFYTMDGTTRTHRATINATGLFINQPATNRNAGIIGSYDYTKAALIWSMGASYNVAADGSGLGSLYGAAYGYGGQAYLGSKALAGGHQFIWCENGAPQVALGNTGVWVKKGGGIKWDPYVESASDASDVTQIIQVASGVAGGTELRIQQANDANDVINLMSHSCIYLNSKKAFTIYDSWLRINEDKGFSSGVYFGSSVVRTDGELWSDSIRLVDNWVGFYNAVQGDTRYGYIQANANRMYFRKENGVSTYHFDFGGHIYTPNNIYAHEIWANQTDGEKQIGVDNGTAGNLYMWSNNSEKGLYSGSGYQTGSIIRITSNRVYFADAYTRTNTALAYSQAGLAASAMTWFTCWNGYELRAISKAETMAAVRGAASGSWAISVTGNSNTANYQNCVHTNEIRYARNGNMSSANSLWQGWAFAEGKVAVINDWRFGNGNGGLAPIYGSKVYGAVWNDYAECRASDEIEPGLVIVDDISGKMQRSTTRLQAGAHIISDTYGHLIGKSDEAKTPIGVSGRVLVTPYQPRENYKIGDALCAAPNGTADIMTREEIREYPDRIIGIVSEIPEYEIWTQIFSDYKDVRDKEKVEQARAEIQVNGRIWVYVK